MSASPELQAYWREAAGWDADRWLRMRRSERLAWCGAVCGWTCALAGALALVLLLPLKRVEPYVIRVDNSTGLIDVVPVLAGRASASELVTRYLLTHYVTVCERFNLATAESDYEECSAFHGAQRNQAWYAQWNPSNAASPLNLYKDGTTVRASVVSVSFFRRASGLEDLAQVRYVRRLRRAGATQEEVSHWVASVQYAYSAPAVQPRLRSWNPLGFRVLDFRPEPEVLPESAPGSPSGRTPEGSGR